MLLIENGYVIDPAQGTEGYADLLAEDGKITRIGQHLYAELESGGMEFEVIDATGCMIAPGLVDVHVHFREPGFPHKEEIATGAKAAAKGGFTTVVLMANTKPAVDSVETLRYVLEQGGKTDIHVETCATVTMGMKGEELVPMERLKGSGAAGFTDDGVPILDAPLVKKAMQEAARLGVPISFHEEDPQFIKNNGINSGKASAYFGIGGSPREAEIKLVKRDLELALETGACINIQHISSREAVELVRQAKHKGGDIHAEATPHHFTLTEEAVIRYGALAKMNPPLREEADRQAIIEGLRDGAIDIIATDHAPHSEAEKAKPITEAPSGITGLETALSLGITGLVDTGSLTMMELLRKMTCNPAAMYRLDAGYLAEGGPADLVIFDPEETWIPGEYASRSSNTPFTGWQLKGVVKYTLCGGRVVYREKEQ